MSRTICAAKSSSVLQPTVSRTSCPLPATTCIWGNPGDDTTVAVAKVIQASHVHLLASPPQDKKDDERMVQDFLQDSDIRIICGGSSGNMVARVLNKPLRASLGISGSGGSADGRDRRHPTRHRGRADTQQDARDSPSVRQPDGRSPESGTAGCQKWCRADRQDSCPNAVLT